MLRAAAINMYNQMHGPSISGTGTRGVDLRKVLCVLMKNMVKSMIRKPVRNITPPFRPSVPETVSNSSRSKCSRKT